MSIQTEKPSEQNYQTFRVVNGDLPTGLLIKAETETEARRQLAIAGERLGFSIEDVNLQ